MIEMEIKKEPNRERDRRKEAETDACCPCHVCLCVCVHHVSALLWSLTTCTSSIIHSFALTESRGLIAVQPEGGRGERDVMCNWTSERAAWPNALMCIKGVCACRCLCVWAWSLPSCASRREPGVLMCDSQYSAVVPVEHIRLNHWCWHTHIHVLPPECCLRSILCAEKWAGAFPSHCSQYAAIVENLW